MTMHVVVLVVVTFANTINLVVTIVVVRTIM